MTDYTINSVKVFKPCNVIFTSTLWLRMKLK